MTRNEHLLVILMEECAEIQKECSKALRFGLLEYYGPAGSETNKESITREINDFMGVVELLQVEDCIGVISDERVSAKKAKIEKFLKYSKKAGTLT